VLFFLRIFTGRIFCFRFILAAAHLSKRIVCKSQHDESAYYQNLFHGSALFPFFLLDAQIMKRFKSGKLISSESADVKDYI
jgi:hypothetical protein